MRTVRTLFGFVLLISALIAFNGEIRAEDAPSAAVAADTATTPTTPAVTPPPAEAAPPAAEPGPGATTLDQNLPETESEPTKKSVPIPRKGRRIREKEAEGSEAPNRFEADPVIRSKYQLKGQPLEVDPD